MDYFSRSTQIDAGRLPVLSSAVSKLVSRPMVGEDGAPQVFLDALSLWGNPLLCLMAVHAWLSAAKELVETRPKDKIVTEELGMVFLGGIETTLKGLQKHHWLATRPELAGSLQRIDEINQKLLVQDDARLQAFERLWNVRVCSGVTVRLAKRIPRAYSENNNHHWLSLLPKILDAKQSVDERLFRRHAAMSLLETAVFSLNAHLVYSRDLDFNSVSHVLQELSINRSLNKGLWRSYIAAEIQAISAFEFARQPHAASVAAVQHLNAACQIKKARVISASHPWFLFSLLSSQYAGVLMNSPDFIHIAAIDLDNSLVDAWLDVIKYKNNGYSAYKVEQVAALGRSVAKEVGGVSLKAVLARIQAYKIDQEVGSKKDALKVIDWLSVMFRDIEEVLPGIVKNRDYSMGKEVLALVGLCLGMPMPIKLAVTIESVLLYHQNWVEPINKNKPDILKELSAIPWSKIELKKELRDVKKLQSIWYSLLPSTQNEVKNALLIVSRIDDTPVRRMLSRLRPKQEQENRLIEIQSSLVEILLKSGQDVLNDNKNCIPLTKPTIRLRL